MKKIKVILTLSLVLATFGLNYKLYANESTLSQSGHRISYEEKYEKEKRQSIKRYNLRENYDMPKEVKDDINALSNISYLKPKTDSNYEIALAYENGDYTYLDSADTIEEAIEIADNTKNKVQSNVIPAVINILKQKPETKIVIKMSKSGYATAEKSVTVLNLIINDADSDKSK